MTVSNSSRSRNRGAPGRIASSVATCAPSDDPAPPAQTLPPSGRFWPPVVGTALWIAFLVLLALLTANPTTLNIAQIAQAELVLKGSSADGKEHWHISQSWPPDSVKENVRIQGLENVELGAGMEYLIPVRRVEDGVYQVVVAPAPLAAPLIYPATDDVVADLEAILDGLDRRPAHSPPAQND